MVKYNLRYFLIVGTPALCVPTTGFYSLLSFYIALCFKCAFAEHILRNLHGIEGCTFLNLVSYHPERQAIGITKILTYTPYKHRVFTCYIEGHWVFVFHRCINYNHTFSGGKGFSCLLNAYRAFGFNPYCL